jgi:transposase
MEDVLDVYQRPYDPQRPVVCLDETSKQLHDTPYGTLPMQSGQPQREDYEYSRHGTCNLFLAVEPLRGRRQVRVTDRRTSLDFAEQLRLLVDEDYPEVDMIVLVTDNLNTHGPACLYERFEPAEAHRVASKLEWHYTPEHGSWLNMAECELSVLARQCLNRRIGDKTMLSREVAAWQDRRNRACRTIDWQFTTADARIKLKRLYPVVKEQNSD